MTRRGTAVPRYQRYTGPPLLSQGFRPFFLLACGWSAAAMALWLARLTGTLGFASALPGPAWHAHTMTAGYLGAALTGYALTAVPNWTGRLPLQGAPLVGLVALWVAGRAANLAGAELATASVLAIDLALPLALLAAVMRELNHGRGWRGLPIAFGIAGLAIATVATHSSLAATIPGNRLAVAVFTGLIAVVGGRLIPSLTATTLRKRRRPPPAPRDAVDRLAEALSVAAGLAWSVRALHPITVSLAGLAFVANAWRLLRWRGWAVADDPALAGLHLGYAFLVAGLGLMVAGPVVPDSAAIHALTAGAMGCVPLAVMARLGLAHACGRLRPGWPFGLALGLIAAAALARVVAAWTPAFLVAAAVLWIAGFGLVVGYLAPFFARRRARAATA